MSTAERIARTSRHLDEAKRKLEAADARGRVVALMNLITHLNDALDAMCRAEVGS